MDYLNGKMAKNTVQVFTSRATNFLKSTSINTKKTFLHKTKLSSVLTRTLKSVSNKQEYLNTYHLGDRVAVMNSFPASSVDMIITSPPYNVGKDYKNHHDLMEYEAYLTFLNDTWQASKRILKTGGRIAINITSMTWNREWKCLYNDVINQMQALGFIMRCDILWYKQSMSKRTAWGSFQSPSNPHVIQPYEFIFVFSKGDKKLPGNKEDIDITKEEFIKFSDAFWNIKAETRFSKKHPAPFPEELIYRLIKFYTFKHNTVLDMFGGSGTVAVVAKQTNRNFIYIDNCKEYMLFAKKRVGSLSNTFFNSQ